MRIEDFNTENKQALQNSPQQIAEDIFNKITGELDGITINDQQNEQPSESALDPDDFINAVKYFSPVEIGSKETKLEDKKKTDNNPKNETTADKDKRSRINLASGLPKTNDLFTKQKTARPVNTAKKRIIV